MAKVRREVRQTGAVGNSYAEIQTQRGYYLDRMASVDQMLSLWFLHRLRVPADLEAPFYRLIETGSLGSRIALFADLADSPEHMTLADRLREANELRNQLAHGQLLPAPDPNSSLPLVDEWVVALSKRKGRVEVALTAAEVEVKRRELTDLLNGLLHLTRNLPLG